MANANAPNPLAGQTPDATPYRPPPPPPPPPPPSPSIYEPITRFNQICGYARKPGFYHGISHDEVELLVLQTAERVIRKIIDNPSVYEGCDLKGLTIAAAHTEASNYRRSAKYEAESLRVAADERGESAPASGQPDNVTHNSMLAAALVSALASLPPCMRRRFCLHHINGLSYSEIAVLEKVSLKMVGASIAQAKVKLARVMAAFNDRVQPDDGRRGKERQ